MSVAQEWIILIGILFSIVAIANYLIHLYYKGQHKKALNQIKNEKYQIFYRLKLKQSYRFGFHLNWADLIILENYIILLLFNRPIKQAQPVIVFYKEKLSEKTKTYTGQKHKIEDISLTEKEFQITCRFLGILDSKKMKFSIVIPEEENKKITDALFEYNLITSTGSQ